MKLDLSLIQSLLGERSLKSVRKLRLQDPTIWAHHRGGWTDAISLIQEHLHTPDGTRFVSAVEELISADIVLEEPWVGFVHQVPRTNIEWYVDLDRMLSHPAWRRSMPYCRGLFTLSSYVRDFLITHDVPMPVAMVFYPVFPVEEKFSFDKFINNPDPKIVGIGEYLRNHQALFDLPSGQYNKLLLAPSDLDFKAPKNNGNVQVIDRLDNNAYDKLLTRNLVFLNLLDAPANTTVVECIDRNTPVLVNRLPGVVEYLGEDYPFYYNDLEEAAEKAADDALIEATTRYLKSAPIKELLRPEMFLVQIQNSTIYRSLPVPKSWQSKFETYDVSIVVCSYNRVNHIEAILEAFATQRFEGCLEVVLWNNNAAEREAIDAIAGKFQGRLPLTVIHSSQNFYCIVRLSMAHLIRSELMIICDDDVIPGPDYVATFLEKWAEYGPRAVLCCRGHVFHSHQLSEENPHHFWRDYEHMTFFDEAVDDCQVHFLHADNCLIPKKLLTEAASFDLDRYEFALVDDYWLSFVLSHNLKVPIWKIRADQILRFTESAEDPEIALFHNPLVAEQRVNFYVHHMRQGWPYDNHQPQVMRAAVGLTELAQWQSPEAVWDAGFRGVNIHSESLSTNLQALAEYGVKVVRLGACGGAQDFRYLLDREGTSPLVDVNMINRLKSSLKRMGEYGFYVILTLSNLPGRLFFTEGDVYDRRLWQDPSLQDRLVEMWVRLARELGECPNVLGYDLINEPCLPEESHLSWFQEGSADSVPHLNRLYRRLVDSIREVDTERLLVIESSNWGNPLTLEHIEPIDDPRIAYSFHMYTPSVFTDRAKNRGKICYPGMIPLYPPERYAECEFWDRDRLSALLSYVADWQDDHQVPPSRIYVGEFGVCREVRGAAEYLRDLASIFDGHQWNWTMYAFREDQWDAMDYELGTDMNNMLKRSSNDLFGEMARWFK